MKTKLLFLIIAAGLLATTTTITLSNSVSYPVKP